MKGIFVVGAGPAGMFAAREIALAGFDVTLFNRDIKPGGLAEYGIYPVKDKMSFGLRKQFAKVLDLPNLHYFGHVQVGTDYDLTIEDLEAMHPTAIAFFACGSAGRGNTRPARRKREGRLCRQGVLSIATTACRLTRPWTSPPGKHAAHHRHGQRSHRHCALAA